MFGNCNHCCFCCGHPCTMLGVSLFISCKNKIQCVCVEKKKQTNKTRMEVNNKKLGMIGQRLYYGQREDLVGIEERKEPCFRNKIFRV